MTPQSMPEGSDFAPCPFCKQYSHSIGDDQLAAAFRHFQSMYAHPVRGTPMGDNFDEQTQDAAQVLMAAARPTPDLGEDDRELVEALRGWARKLRYGPDQAWLEDAADRIEQLHAELASRRAG